MSDRSTTWISQGFEAFIAQHKTHQITEFDYDIIIIGSGYGGAIAASELAGLTKHDKPLRICVLERGNEYLSGMFPSDASDLPKHIRVSGSRKFQHQQTGLFDLHTSASLNTLVANGLGGGSLINAGVMLEAKPSVFNHRWPKELQYTHPKSLFSGYYESTKQLLEAKDKHGDNTIERHQYHQQEALKKHVALKQLAVQDSKNSTPLHFSSTPLTIAQTEKINNAGVKLQACNLCGDCATGCNQGAKNSLDTNLLVKAFKQGVEIYTGATVRSIQPINDTADGWCINAVHTKKHLQKREGSPTKITTKKIILAAGTLGSTEILMRSKSESLIFSDQLGKSFSANGDMLSAIFDQKNVVNAVANENKEPNDRYVGPTITSMIDLRDKPPHLLIQEVTVPSSLQKIFEDVTTTLNSVSKLTTMDTEIHTTGHLHSDPQSVDSNVTKHTAAYVLMGDDGARGSLQWDKDSTNDAIQVHWPSLSNHRLFHEQINTLKDLLTTSNVGGTLLTNPMWRLTSAPQRNKGTLLTVHPLGGCVMADDASLGVVNHIGQVFNSSNNATVYEGLVVLDGAIIPSAIGANPALTIAAVSLRAIQQLIKIWELTTPSPQITPTSLPIDRPKYSHTNTDKTSTSKPTTPTRIEITERLTGQVTLTDADNHPLDCTVDLTLRFNDFSIQNFVRNKQRRITVKKNPPNLSSNNPSNNASISQLRIFDRKTWYQLTQKGVDESELDKNALLISPVSGSLDILTREASTPSIRVARALWPWLRNRGLRELWQHIFQRLFRKRPSVLKTDKSFLSRYIETINNIKSVTSRAGEIRKFDYQLQLQQPELGWPKQLSGFDHAASEIKISGLKRITYKSHANPLRQLQDIHLKTFPGLQPARHQPNQSPAFLRFDSRFLVQNKEPLLKIVQQQNQPSALIDMAALSHFFLRVILNIHKLSFHSQNSSPTQTAKRLPDFIQGIPTPTIIELKIDSISESETFKAPTTIRLTHYSRKAWLTEKHDNFPPVVMIHGHSASGTTYTHHSLKPSLAQYFWDRGRDVWIVDLRTSSGLASALHPWSFEDIAFSDIPVAIDHICHVSQCEKVDVIAHCMGSSMLSMAILATPNIEDKYYQERAALPNRINKAVLSQVGPRVVFSADNMFKAYILDYFRQAMPSITYDAQRSSSASYTGNVFDRILSVLPYPEKERRLENPARPWVRRSHTGSRRRLDGIYGQTFKLSNISKKTLKHIDDFFGPINLKTISRVTQFAFHEQVTNKHGENDFVTNENLKKYWKFPTLSIHGSDNGVADIATLNRMQQTMAAAGCDYHTEILQGFGHQDSLIGKNSKINFHKISNFLDTEHPEKCDAAEHPHRFHCETPYSGPVVGTLSTSNKIAVSLGINPQRKHPDFIVFLAVNINKHKIELANVDMPLFHSLSMTFASPIQQSWIKTELAVPAQFEKADGILVLLLDDQCMNWDEISCPSYLPNNLLDFLDTNTETTPESQKIRQYLQLNVLSDKFTQSIENTLKQPRNVLESAIIQWPKKANSQQKEQKKEQQTQFALAACQYPAGLLDKTLAYASYNRLAEHLDKKTTSTPKNLMPQFIILMGDQVYTDASAGLFDPTDSHDRYTRPYHKWLSQHAVKSVFRRLPSYMMLDDHEILDNWDRSELTLGNAKLFEYGKRAYLNFQRNLHQTPQPLNSDTSNTPLWYTFEQQGFDFFMLDTRTEREGRSIKNSDSTHNIKPLMEAKLISDNQFQALLLWLERTKSDNEKPRFIVSASMLLPRRLHSTTPYSAIHSDAWDGYPRTLDQLLEHIAFNDVKNLIFLSGDEHVSNVTTIDLTAKSIVLEKTTSTRIYSIHSSALYSPYPFANSNPDDFASKETFNVGKNPFQCKVSSTFYPGDGFALLSTYQIDGNWHISSDFNRAEDTFESSEKATSWTIKL
ncbi:hypothetical protein A9Q81_14640 [Gammaproteobacteria bacterium 42_54_T18]|nr:hypothetical protein A9Q81_14640 [Gammaproteobacteria bacterium 42_54_T18]